MVGEYGTRFVYCLQKALDSNFFTQKQKAQDLEFAFHGSFSIIIIIIIILNKQINILFERHVLNFLQNSSWAPKNIGKVDKLSPNNKAERTDGYKNMQTPTGVIPLKNRIKTTPKWFGSRLSTQRPYSEGNQYDAMSLLLRFHSSPLILKFRPVQTDSLCYRKLTISSNDGICL